MIISKLPETDLRVKLLEMGFLEGREVRVAYRAPFGDPIAIDLNDYVMALRLDEAELIEVVNC